MKPGALNPEAFNRACERVPELSLKAINAALRAAKVGPVRPLGADHVWRINTAFREYVTARLSRVAISQSRKRLQRGTLEEQARMRKYGRDKSHNRHEGNPELAQLVAELLPIHAELTGKSQSLSFLQAMLSAFRSQIPDNLEAACPGLREDLDVDHDRIEAVRLSRHKLRVLMLEIGCTQAEIDAIERDNDDTPINAAIRHLREQGLTNDEIGAYLQAHGLPALRIRALGLDNPLNPALRHPLNSWLIGKKD